jgi:hypothetical protein
MSVQAFELSVSRYCISLRFKIKELRLLRTQCIYVRVLCDFYSK